MHKTNTILLDNGAYEIKASIFDQNKKMANEPKKTFNGAVIDKSRN